ncbi:ribosomal RNA small subunit methyltransferase A [Candidatus Bathyarchaeota archaeon]|nr:ribosomal RNA small subunit methyltransferase A [Candidatus Bathyarchaeota archaeon]
MTLLDDLQFLIAKYHIKPRISIGQCFCIDPFLLRRMITYSSVTEKDVVLEIGAGFGFLTRLLTDVAKDVITIELDPKLVKAIKEIFRSKKNIRIIQGNFLKIHLPKFNKIVANPPYSISSNLILHLFRLNFQYAIMTLQKEFVQKLVAQKGSKNYRSLSVIASYSASIKMLEDVPRESFYPHPNVDSTIISIKPQKPLFNVGDKHFYFKMVRRLFTHRNKKLQNALKFFIRNESNIANDAIKTLVKELPYLDLKVYELTPEEFGIISYKLYSIFKENKIILFS